MRQPRHDHALEVAEHLFERLGPFGRRRGKLGAHLTRFRPRHHGALLEAGAVVGDPVDESVAEAPELVGLHGRGAPALTALEGAPLVFRWVLYAQAFFRL
jgi:hypothetical protein